MSKLSAVEEGAESSQPWWLQRLKKLAYDGGAWETEGNRVRCFFEGDEAYDAMLEAIDRATRYVHMEMYMFFDDRTGTLFQQAFLAAVKRGVAVRVAYDAIGSAETSGTFFETMETGGVEVCCFRPVAPWRKRSGVLGRNHRKNLIVDGEVAFAGGMNIADPWSRRAVKGLAWRDTHVKLEGPAVQACHQLFLETWRKVGGKAPWRELVELYQLKFPETDRPGRAKVVVVAGRGFGRRKAIRRVFTTMIRASRTSVKMTVPYFMPPRLMLSMLRQQAEKSPVEIIVPRDSDVPVADWIRDGLYPFLLKSGVDVREYTEANMHAKTMVVDDRIAVVGSANFDVLSMSMNWELTLVIEDEETVGQLLAQREIDLVKTERVLEEGLELKRPWWRRFLSWLGAGILRKM